MARIHRASDGTIHIVCRRSRNRTAKASADAARILVQAWPESITQEDSHGTMPLHSAFDGPYPPLALVKYLVQQDSGAARVHNSYTGEPLLHSAIDTEEARLPVVQLLVKEYPGALDAVSENGRRPLFVAIDGNAPLGVIRLLVRAGPPGAFGLAYDQDDDGCYPWNLAARMGRADVARLLARKAPDLVHDMSEEEEESDDGCYPIHTEAADGNVHSVRFLLETWPDKVRATTRTEGRIPLHEAARAGNLPVVRYLVAQWRDSVREKTIPQGLLALHEAAQCGEPALVRTLVEAWPESVRETTSNHELALHVATAHKHVDAARVLVQEWPGSVLQATLEEGRLPIHICLNDYAPSYQPSDELAKLLVEGRPDSLGVADRNGCLPIHIAVGGRSSCLLDLVQYLYDKHPASVQQRDGAGCLPLHIAALKDGPLDVLYFLLSKHPEAIRG
jgi:ankyrin repeat protein